MCVLEAILIKIKAKISLHPTQKQLKYNITISYISKPSYEKRIQISNFFSVNFSLFHFQILVTIYFVITECASII